MAEFIIICSVVANGINKLWRQRPAGHVLYTRIDGDLVDGCWYFFSYDTRYKNLNVSTGFLAKRLKQHIHF